MPREAILFLTTYAQLDLYLAELSADELGLVLLLGRHGTGKRESVELALRLTDRHCRAWQRHVLLPIPCEDVEVPDVHHPIPSEIALRECPRGLLPIRCQDA